MKHMGDMMPEFRLMLEAMVVANSQQAGANGVGWVALDVAQWMLDMACTELENSVSEPELRKVRAMAQVVATVSESLAECNGDVA